MATTQNRTDLAAAAQRRLEQQDQTLWPGERVRVCDSAGYLPVPEDSEWGGVWLVVRVNPKTVSVEQGGRRAKVPPMLLAKTTDPLPEPPEMAVPGRVPAGALLRVTPDAAARLGQGITARTLLVSLVDKGDKVNAARLGGDNDRYWRLPRAMLAEIVDPATVLNPEAIR